MGHHELWFTELLNNYFAAPAQAALDLVGMQPGAPGRPWSNYVAMEILVVVLMMVLFALLRSRLSVERPGTFQQLFEVIYNFQRQQADEIIGHDGRKYVAFAGTLFLFVLFGNLIGVIPSFESPTMFAPVPAGCAMAAFLVYNILGLKEQGLFGYLKHFWGPIWWLGFLMFPIEIISHLARPMSLTIRLYANMVAGEKVTLVFLGLTYFLVPAVFMGLHVFVSLIQAFIFMVLTMIYIGGAVEHETH
jgi:F-type H+-transporting ATPase subunit a